MGTFYALAANWQNRTGVVSLTDFSSGWNSVPSSFFGDFIAPGRCTGSLNQRQANGSGTSGTYTFVHRFFTTPLKAQTISGTVKGVIPAGCAAAGSNYTLAITIRVMKADGTERSTLLPITASTNSAYYFPVITGLQYVNRRFRDSSDATDIPLTTTAISEGDFLCIEVGAYQQSTSTALIYLAANAQTNRDCAENDTDVSPGSGVVNSGWIEFSQNLILDKSYFGDIVTTPATLDGTNATLTITPQVRHHRKGDLIVVLAQSRASTTWTVSTTGGQTWTSETAFSGTNIFCRAFWCVFNGTWTASPVFSSTSSTCTSLALFNVIAANENNTWSVHKAQSTQAFAAAASYSLPAHSTSVDNTVMFGGCFSADDNLWSSVNGDDSYNTWGLMGDDSYTNLASTDQSMFLMRYFGRTAITTPLAQYTTSQTRNGNDAFVYWTQTWVENLTATPASLLLSNQSPFQSMLVR